MKKMPHVKLLGMLAVSTSLSAQTVYFDDGTVYDLLPSESVFIAPEDVLISVEGDVYEFEITAPQGYVPQPTLFETDYAQYKLLMPFKTDVEEEQ